jgi:hypothetical protein
VQTRTSQTFLNELGTIEHAEERRSALADRLDPSTRDALERLRRGRT